MLSKTDLKYLLLDNLKKYTENVLFLGGTNPYHFYINDRQFYILIRNISDSGNGRGNVDESRLQISYLKSLEEPLVSGVSILVLGYNEQHNVFAAWDPNELRARLNQKTTISVYSRFSILEEASISGFAVYIDSNDKKNICFREDYIGVYIENSDKIHYFTIEELKSIRPVENYSFDSQLESVKGKITVVHTKFKRDIKFINKVKEVYNHRCAICGISLGLVEAAHIIPHSHRLGTDEISNGISLCSLHHKAYDSSLIYFKEDYSIILNEHKIEYLTKINKFDNLHKFISLSEPVLLLPAKEIHYPKIANIIIANEIRGITI